MQVERICDINWIKKVLKKIITNKKKINWHIIWHLTAGLFFVFTLLEAQKNFQAKAVQHIYCDRFDDICFILFVLFAHAALRLTFCARCFIMKFLSLCVKSNVTLPALVFFFFLFLFSLCVCPPLSSSVSCSRPVFLCSLVLHEIFGHFRSLDLQTAVFLYFWLWCNSMIS